MIRRRRNHKAGINRLFRDQINPLKIFDDVESCVKFRSRRVRILAIVDELQRRSRASTDATGTATDTVQR